MPVQIDESFRIDHNLARGKEIEFCESNNVVVRQECANEYKARRSLIE